MVQEQWKSVPDFDGVYEVSDLGRVRRVRTGRILKPFPQQRGYLRVDFTNGSQRKVKEVHRLVAEVFIPNPLNLPEVNHLGPKSDCRATQLEWRSRAGHDLYHMLHDERGVLFDRRNGKWYARYNPAGKRVWLGYFISKQAALKARRAAVEAIPYIL